MHTPGPWRLGPINYADVYGPDGEVIALVTKQREQTVSDALLISVAPQLLASCKWFVSQLESGALVRDISKDSQQDWIKRMVEFTSNLQKAVSAIAKAEGS